MKRSVPPIIHLMNLTVLLLVYKAVVDETGSLNRPQGLWANSDQIDLFIGGDSVLQGSFQPSVLELLRGQLPVTMWNLSISGYGPHQKISALIAYALPKRPKWLVVEFYANNDPSDAIVTELCEDTRSSLCLFSIPEVRHRLLRHPIYSRLIDQADDSTEIFRYHATQNLTLATSRYLIETLKETMKGALIAAPRREVPRSEADGKKSYGFYPDLYPRPLKLRFPVPPEGTNLRQGKRLEWATAGTILTHKNYERLVAELEKMEHKPAVILLYNPSPYELYRDILMDRDPEYDQVAAYQLQTQRSFAQQHGWRIVDLTVPLRQALQVSRAWVYGRYDPSHWSPQGTEIVAPVLRTALLGVIVH